MKREFEVVLVMTEREFALALGVSADYLRRQGETDSLFRPHASRGRFHEALMGIVRLMLDGEITRKQAVKLQKDFLACVRRDRPRAMRIPAGNGGKPWDF